MAAQTGASGQTGSSGAEGSVLVVLLAQHARIRDLMAAVRAATGRERVAAFDALRRLLAAHETAEEIVLRPVSVQIMDRDDAAARNHEERRLIGLLAELEKLDPLGGEFAELFTRFEKCVVEHLALEEFCEFPMVGTEVGAREQVTMGHWIQRALVLGPTHAHPVPAGHPNAQRATVTFTALADHARDRLERARGH